MSHDLFNIIRTGASYYASIRVVNEAGAPVNLPNSYEIRYYRRGVTTPIVIGPYAGGVHSMTAASGIVNTYVDASYFSAYADTDGSMMLIDTTTGFVVFTIPVRYIGFYDAAEATGNFTFTSDGTVRVVVSSDELTLLEMLALKADITSVRERLTAARTYYVRTDGSNSNTGLVNSAGGAFLTIQKAIATAMTLDCAGFNVTVHVADGTYTGNISIVRPLLSGGLTLVGNVTTPANCLISHNAYGAFNLIECGDVSVSGFKIVNSAASSLGQGIQVSGGSRLVIQGNMDFGACTRAHIEVGSGARLFVNSNYTISGSAPSHWALSDASQLLLSTRTITCTGTPAFSSGFLVMSNVCAATIYGLTKVGSATGPYYSISRNSSANVFGGGASYLFGSTAGSTATGGQYA